jgi:hypothetical protein
MPSEMLSGPDLGAGFLHQLTIDRDDDRTTFTYHAQDGGQDANGPPKGPLDALGFVHPPSPCQFGGRGCWHRRFLLPFAETPKVRQAYNRFRFVLEATMDQVYSGAPVPIDTALAEVVQRLRGPLAAERVDWYVGGSAAARLLGAELTPHDIDLGTTRDGVDRIAHLLPELLIEPAAATDWPPGILVRAARAFVGTFRSGARVEWAVPLERRDPSPVGEWGGVPSAVQTVEVPYADAPLRVTRPEYSLVRMAEKHRRADEDAVVRVVQKLGPDAPLLRALLAQSSLGAAERERVLARVVS